MKKSPESTRPAAATVSIVTPSTMPESFKVSAEHVSVPTLGERTRRAHDLLSLVQLAMLYSHLGSHALLDHDSVVETVGYVPDADAAMDAANRALAEAIGEVYWVLNHPEAAVRELRVPTPEDWACFQDEQETLAEGGAR